MHNRIPTLWDLGESEKDTPKPSKTTIVLENDQKDSHIHQNSTIWQLVFELRAVERDEHVQIGVEKELPKEVRSQEALIISKIEQAEASS